MNVAVANVSIKLVAIHAAIPTMIMIDSFPAKFVLSKINGIKAIPIEDRKDRSITKCVNVESSHENGGRFTTRVKSWLSKMLLEK
jgi:hypothetical protein